MDATDPWSDARDRAREEVRAALAPRRAVCRNCGNEEMATRRTCSRCGAPYVELRTPGMTARTRRRIVIGAAAAVAVLIVAALLIVPSVQHSKSVADARARAAQRAALIREQRRLTLDQRLHSAAAPGNRAALRTLRGVQLTARLRADLEASITADARARVRAGTLGGPILVTHCSPVGGVGGPPLGKFSCTAVSREIVRKPGAPAAGALGYPFWAIVDYRRLKYRWCKVNPRAGEGFATPSSASLAVPLPRGCDVSR